MEEREFVGCVAEVPVAGATYSRVGNSLLQRMVVCTITYIFLCSIYCFRADARLKRADSSA